MFTKHLGEDTRGDGHVVLAAANWRSGTRLDDWPAQHPGRGCFLKRARLRRRPSVVLLSLLLGVAGGLLALLHRIAKAADAFSQTLAEFGQLLGPEYDQSDRQNDQQVHRLKKSFKHTKLLFSSI